MINDFQLSKMLLCMARLEQEVSRFLLSIAGALEGGDEAKAILVYVGLDSLKHEYILEQIAKDLVKDVEVDLENCQDLVGTESVKLIKLFRKKTKELIEKSISIEYARRLIEEQTRMEGQIGEEYLNLCQAKVFSIVATSRKVKKVLELISEDEEKHIELLNEALKYLI